jgi:TetR/AcrR family transcriptional regulator, regulator of cefoperazone and chloramphenicol sensitivity
MLNVSSTDDRTTAARIRDAAISYVGAHGWERATSRQIAAEAGVPVGLLNYHFGSKDGLRRACDDWVVAVIAEDKSLVLSAGPIPQLTSYLDDHPELRPVMAYLSMSTRSGGPVAERFFDRIVEVTVELMTQAADAGIFRRYEDLPAIATVFVAYGLGVSMFGSAIARHLGGTDLLDTETYRRYVAANLEIFSHPLILDEHLGDSLRDDDVAPASAGDDIRKENA